MATTVTPPSMPPVDLSGDPRRHRRERFMGAVFLVAALISVVISALILFSLFSNYEAEAKRLLAVPLTLPAYEMILKAAHSFNMLDARGAISVTERAAYMGRIRNLSRGVAQAYYDSREKLGFPMCGDGRKAA